MVLFLRSKLPLHLTTALLLHSATAFQSSYSFVRSSSQLLVPLSVLSSNKVAFSTSSSSSSSSSTATRLSSTMTTTDNGDSKTTVPPALPEDYVVPDVWEFQEQEGMMGGMNRPYAGARFEKKLQRGQHDLQLHSLGTPNGIKVTILLEELNDLHHVEYDAWIINIGGLEQFGSDFVEINPNSKIPAMLDYSMDPPLRIFESGSILKYLAEKYDVFIPKDPRKRVECFNWLFWQMGGAPFIGGGFGHFYKYAPVKIQYAIDRYTMETKRQLDVLDKHLADKEYVVGDEITIADFAIFPWIRACKVSYGAAEFLQVQNYKNVLRWLDTIEARPAVKRGLRVNGYAEDAVPERHSRADFE